jgi:hypothetical protein
VANHFIEFTFSDIFIPNYNTNQAMKKIYTIAFGLSFALAGYAQNALDFDGIDDKVDVGNPAGLQISGNNITVEAWVYPTTWASLVWQGNVVNQENNSTNDGFMLRVGESGKINFGVGTANTSWYELNTGSNVLSLNAWTHIAGTYDGTTLKIYKDGVQVGTSTVSAGAVVAGNVALTIGARRTDRFFSGKIDEVRIWTVTRTAAELTQGMTTEYCGSQTGLEFYAKFNEGQAGGSNTGITTLPDFSGNANNGTLGGFALSGANSNWVGGKALTLPPGDSVAVSDSLCDGYNYYVGDTVISTPGNYLVHTANINGCDSLINLTLYPQSVDATTAYVGQSFMANHSGVNVTYQWCNCASGGILVGETNQVFWPSNNAEYAVTVKENDCEKKSDCMSLLYASTNEYVLGGFNLYPSPANEFLIVDLQDIADAEEINILSIAGQLVLSQDVNQDKMRLNIQGLPSGTYIVNVKTESDIRVERFVKN